MISTKCNYETVSLFQKVIPQKNQVTVIRLNIRSVYTFQII